MRQYTYDVGKETHAPQLSLAHHVCIIIWVVFFIAFCDDSKQSSKQHTYSCLGNGFPHTYTHTAVTHLQHVLGESIWNVLAKPTNTVKFLLVTILTSRHCPAIISRAQDPLQHHKWTGMVQNTTLIQLTVRRRQHMVLAHRYIAHVAGQRVFLFFFFAWEGAYEMKESSST